MKTETSRRAFSFAEVSRMFSISTDSVKRLWKGGDLLTITIGGRRLVPISEVEKIERQGIGTPRKSRTSTGKVEGGQ
jgi:hypothetical protein